MKGLFSSAIRITDDHPASTPGDRSRTLTGTKGWLGGEAQATAMSALFQKCHVSKLWFLLIPDCMSYDLKGEEGSSQPDGKDSCGNLDGREVSHQRTQSIRHAHDIP